MNNHDVGSIKSCLYGAVRRRSSSVRDENAALFYLFYIKNIVVSCCVLLFVQIFTFHLLS
jgi:hypothetical protein